MKVGKLFNIQNKVVLTEVVFPSFYFLQFWNFMYILLYSQLSIIYQFYILKLN